MAGEMRADAEYGWLWMDDGATADFQHLECRRCGCRLMLWFPIGLGLWADSVKGFVGIHKWCRQDADHSYYLDKDIRRFAPADDTSDLPLV